MRGKIGFLKISRKYCWLLLMFGCTAIGYAQQIGPDAGGHEIQLWTGGGTTVPGGTKDTGVWNLGLRYG